MPRKRYAIVGLGGRHEMFFDVILGRHSAFAELVGLCDNNAGRLRRAVERGRARGAEVPGYAADDFDRMLAETRPDIVIVTTRDCYHDEYVVRALRAGRDAITEKPMTIDAVKCRGILDARRETGGRVRVTFNYRYSPVRTQIKDLLMSGVIGEVLSVDFHWMLDTRHGADYFRRWHRNKANSGGLLVHKATHHFDLVNWWLSTVPERVYASGHRRFYIPETANRLGLAGRAERCHDCSVSARCPFFLDMAGNAGLRTLYLDHEEHDGYHRDQCVFSDAIDIEDCMNLCVDYASGARMSYSLNAFCPWEGYWVAFNGSKGRLEHKCEETVYINADGSVPGALKPEGTWIRVYPQRGQAYAVEPWTCAGGHGGGDDPMLDDIFLPEPPEDRYLRLADERAGAYSILVGAAANESMRTGGAVAIGQLVPQIPLPDYPPMPTGAEALV